MLLTTYIQNELNVMCVDTFLNVRKVWRLIAGKYVVGMTHHCQWSKFTGDEKTTSLSAQGLSYNITRKNNVSDSYISLSLNGFSMCIVLALLSLIRREHFTSVSTNIYIFIYFENYSSTPSCGRTIHSVLHKKCMVGLWMFFVFYIFGKIILKVPPNIS